MNSVESPDSSRLLPRSDDGPRVISHEQQTTAVSSISSSSPIDDHMHAVRRKTWWVVNSRQKKNGLKTCTARTYWPRSRLVERPRDDHEDKSTTIYILIIKLALHNQLRNKYNLSRKSVIMKVMKSQEISRRTDRPASSMFPFFGFVGKTLRNPGTQEHMYINDNAIICMISFMVECHHVPTAAPTAATAATISSAP